MPAQQMGPPVALTAEAVGIPGLRLLHEFITEQEEQQLLAALDQQPWRSLAKRRVQHYGYEFAYTVGGHRAVWMMPPSAADGRRWGGWATAAGRIQRS